MWRSCWPGRTLDEVPITHVTNGVHVPTWLAPSVRELLMAVSGPAGHGWSTTPAPGPR